MLTSHGCSSGTLSASDAEGTVACFPRTARAVPDYFRSNATKSAAMNTLYSPSFGTAPAWIFNDMGN
jgi:hypothetical protein